MQLDTWLLRTTNIAHNVEQVFTCTVLAIAMPLIRLITSLLVKQTAKEWQKHSLGDSLMKAIHDFYIQKFEQMTVHFSVCFVTNAYASRWFKTHHDFEVVGRDMLGEDLGKTLGEETDDDDEEGKDDDAAPAADWGSARRLPPGSGLGVSLCSPERATVSFYLC